MPSSEGVNCRASMSLMPQGLLPIRPKLWADLPSHPATFLGYGNVVLGRARSVPRFMRRSKRFALLADGFQANKIANGATLWKRGACSFSKSKIDLDRTLA
jgi:hypothetical protein